MANEVKPTYDCTQQELYSKCETAWGSCKTNILDFTAKKAFCDVAYCDAKLLNITNARALPEDELRQVPSVNLRNDLILLLTPCLDNNQDLKSYIRTAYPKDVQDSNYAAGGGSYYEKAANKNWENVVGMNDAMIGFINAETVTLSANNNMPATFITKVKADALAFKNKYDLFKVATDTGVATNAKIEANNALDKDYKDLLEEGKNVYRHNATKYDLFVDEKIMLIISPPGSASLSLLIIKGDDDTPGSGAEIIMQKAGDPAINLTADANGEAKKENANPGVYKLIVKLPTYADFNGIKEVDKGTNARQTIKLTKL